MGHNHLAARLATISAASVSICVATALIAVPSQKPTSFELASMATTPDVLLILPAPQIEPLSQRQPNTAVANPTKTAAPPQPAGAIEQWEWHLADVINAVTAAATLLLVFVTTWYNRRALRAAADANATAFAAAKDASEKATAGLKLTERSLRLSHRPVLHALNLKTAEYSIAEAFRAVRCDIKNTGTDTAHNLRIAYGPAEGGSVDDAKRQVEVWPLAESFGSLGRDLLITTPAPNIAVDKFEAGATLRFCVSAGYRDTFGDGWRYLAVFLWRRDRDAWQEEYAHHLRLPKEDNEGRDL